MKQYSQEQKQALVSAWQLSGLTQTAFAEQNDVHAGTFNHWVRKARDATFVEVALTEAASPSLCFEITLEGGDRIVVPAHFDAQSLQALVQALRC
jgi:transposase-like protein